MDRETLTGETFDSFQRAVYEQETERGINFRRIEAMLFLGYEKIRDLLAASDDGIHSLDLGCGSAKGRYQPHWPRFLARLQDKLDCKQARTVGVDISTVDPDRIEPFELYSGREYDLMHPEAVLRDFESGSFDLVTNMFFMPQDFRSVDMSPHLRKAFLRDVDATTKTEAEDVRQSAAAGLHANVYGQLRTEIIRLLKDGGTYIEDTMTVYEKHADELTQV